MKIEELKALCQKQIDLSGRSNFDAVVSLKQPGRWGKTNYRKLLGVEGEIVQDNFGDGMVVLYSAKDLLSRIELIECTSHP